MNGVDFLVYMIHLLGHHINIVHEIMEESGQVSPECGKICLDGM